MPDRSTGFGRSVDTGPDFENDRPVRVPCLRRSRIGATASRREMPAHSVYLAFVANAYALTYGQPLDSIIADDFAALIPELFDGEHAYDDIVVRLPRDPREMFRPGVEATFVAGEQSWFLDAVRKNEAVDSVSRAPLRLYYGETDVDIPR